MLPILFIEDDDNFLFLVDKRSYQISIINQNYSYRNVRDWFVLILRDREYYRFIRQNKNNYKIPHYF